MMVLAVLLEVSFFSFSLVDYTGRPAAGMKLAVLCRSALVLNIVLCAECCVLLPLSIRPSSADGGLSSPVGHARLFRSP